MRVRGRAPPTLCTRVFLCACRYSCTRRPLLERRWRQRRGRLDPSPRRRRPREGAGSECMPVRQKNARAASLSFVSLPKPRADAARAHTHLTTFDANMHTGAPWPGRKRHALRRSLLFCSAFCARARAFTRVVQATSPPSLALFFLFSPARSPTLGQHHRIPSFACRARCARRAPLFLLSHAGQHSR